MESILNADGISSGYRQLSVVRDITLSCRGGQITAIVGPNGAGKSTLMKALAGLLPLTTGKLTISGADVTSEEVEGRVRRGIVYVPQLQDVFITLSIQENLEMWAYRHRLRRRQLADALTTTWELFPNLARARRRKAGTLSGGERKMLSIAGSLLAQPKVLMLDEPTAGLAPLVLDSVWHQVHLVADRGIAVVIVEQNVRGARNNCDQLCVLVDGQVESLTEPRCISETSIGELFLGRRLHP